MKKLSLWLIMALMLPILNINRATAAQDGPSLAFLFTCSLCGFQTENDKDLLAHQEDHLGTEHSTDKTVEKTPLSLEDPEPFKCSLCPQSFKGKGGLARHSTFIHKITLAPATVMSKKKINSGATSSERKKRKPTVPRLREEPFQQNSSYVDELFPLPSLEIESLTASFSLPPFLDTDNLFSPLAEKYESSPKKDGSSAPPASHSLGRPGFLCIVCNAVFPISHSYIEHTKTHKHAQNGFRCSECTYTSKTSFDVNRHIKARHLKNHYESLPTKDGSSAPPASHSLGCPGFLCSTCNAIFPTSQGYMEHDKTHMYAQNVFRCSECTYESKKSFDVNRHIKQRHLKTIMPAEIVASESFEPNHSLAPDNFPPEPEDDAPSFLPVPATAGESVNPEPL